ncbi:MAG: 50S ribosomal protein L22 [Rickettsiales bacterium]|jgi:large subunit ribosomal protein L22|nr:50S ribosomal protein L22 [Rickettsiales bacterium]
MSENRNRNYAQAYLRNIRASQTKLDRIVRSIRNLPVKKAAMQLSFCNLGPAPAIEKLLKSAVANAENNHGMDMDKLIIHRIDTGKAFTLRRSRARARGRGARILKPFCHLRIVLTEAEE